MKPILFNTEMVRALLDGRKTVTRRVVKPQPEITPISTFGGSYRVSIEKNLFVKPPYRPGDILYVRETWTTLIGSYLYKADQKPGMKNPGKWRPSIHMPREAARLFLRVKSVGVERLQSITNEQALFEGVPEDGDYPLESPIYCPVCKGEGLIGAIHPVSLGYMEVDCPNCDAPTKRFANLWDSTIKPEDRALYGWEANPWVWVIEFGRTGREEAEK